MMYLPYHTNLLYEIKLMLIVFTKILNILYLGFKNQRRVSHPWVFFHYLYLRFCMRIQVILLR